MAETIELLYVETIYLPIVGVTQCFPSFLGWWERDEGMLLWEGKLPAA